MARPQKLRAVIYARQSQDRTDERAGVERQIEDATALCNARDWEVVDVIVDNDVSASKSRANAEYRRLLDMMRNQEIDRVAVQHTDRLYRSMMDLEHLVVLSEKSGVRIGALFGELDLSTDTGRLVARILAAVARAEVERKGARQKRANLQRREAGVMLWTRRPFGYDRVGDQVVVVDPEARGLRAAAAAILAGASVASQCRALNDAGLLPTGGTDWKINVLVRTLLNPRNVADVTYLGGRTGVSGRWQPILDRDIYERLGEVLGDPTRRAASSTTLKHWLSGALECGRCGDRMFSGRGSQSRVIYRCRKGHLTRSLDLVDEIVTEQLLHRISSPAFAEAFDTGQEASARDRAAELRLRRESMTVMLGRGLLEPAAAMRSLEELAAEIDQAEAEAARAGAGGPVGGLRASDDVTSTWQAMTVRQRRDVYGAVVDNCVVRPVGRGARVGAVLHSIEITWR